MDFDEAVLVLGLGGGFDAFPDLSHHGRFRVSHVVENLGEIRHDIGGEAARCNHIVNARLLRDVLAHHIDHVIHRLHTIQR